MFGGIFLFKGVHTFMTAKNVQHRSASCALPKNASRAYRMRRKLSTKQGRALYKNRMISIEPVFGFIKEQLHLRQFLHRGIDKVSSIWRFTCGVHNQLKLYRAGIHFQTA